MILVLLGTQDKEFPRLLKAIDHEIEKGNINDKVVVQAGQTKYTSDNMQIFDFLSEPEFDKLMDEADLIITHGGAGSILTAIKKGKKVIAAARLAKYHEHHNDHQKQIISEFASQGYILELTDFNKLGKLIDKSKNFKPKKFESNTKNMIHLIENYIENTNHTSWIHQYSSIINYSLVSSMCVLFLFMMFLNVLNNNYYTSMFYSIGISTFFMIFVNRSKMAILQLIIISIITMSLLGGIISMHNSFGLTLILSIIVPILGNCLIYRLFFLKRQ